MCLPIHSALHQGEKCQRQDAMGSGDVVERPTCKAGSIMSIAMLSGCCRRFFPAETDDAAATRASSPPMVGSFVLSMFW